MSRSARPAHAGLALVAVTLSTLLSACGAEPAPAPATQRESRAAGSEATPAGKPPAAGTDADAVDGNTLGDGSAIELHALDMDDIAGANLPGELACAFVRADGAAVLHAAGMVASQDPALGIVKPAGVVETVRAPGGFDGILDNVRFSAPGMTLTIRTTGAATGQGESPPRPAILTVKRADGAARQIEGLWQCGP
jgi:hypothetical protein